MNLKLKKLITFGLFLSLISTNIVSLAQGPCPDQATGVEINYDPLPDANGNWDPGTTVEICVTISDYPSTGANWAHGFAFNFHPLWDISTVNIINAPQTCGTQAPSDWLWVPGGINGYGPGFYFDSGQQGPYDGDPSNNWGDFCGNEDWDFCIEITLGPPPGDPASCGGSGGIYDGENVAPTVQITGDGDTGSWGTAQTCIPTFEDEPIIVNCCDAESGVSPGTLAICENGTFNLFDELIAPVSLGGTWTGPAPWSSPDDQGAFDPLNDPPGEYVYTVTGSDGCTNSTSIFMEYNSLGVVQNAVTCQTSGFLNLSSLVTNVSLPSGGIWYFPGFPGTQTEVVGGSIPIFPGIPSGGYTYVYYDGNNCLTTAILDLDLSGSSAGGVDTTVDFCEAEGTFCPFENLGGNPAPIGSWGLKDANGATVPPLYVNTNICFTVAELEALLPTPIENGFSFSYILGSLFCPPVTTELTVNYFPIFDAGLFNDTSICETNSPILLEDLLGGNPDPGGIWTEQGTGNVWTANPLDPSTIPVGTTLDLIYTGGLAGTGCETATPLSVTILPANADAGLPNTITLCESDQAFQMIDSLNGTPQSGGVWTNSLGQNVGDFFAPGFGAPGTYTYTVASSCDTDFSTLQIIVNPDPDTGGDGTLTICDNAVNQPLDGGLVPPFDIGGNWFDDAFNPVPGGVVDGSSVANGETFYYIIANGPCADTSEVIIDLEFAPNAGTLTNTPQEFCETDGPLDLMTLFTTAPSISNPNYWSGPGGPTTGFFTPATDLGGLYTYTIPDMGCGPASVSINISLETQPNAGTDASLTACPNDPTPINLITLLGGADAGGSWSPALAGGDLGTFDPSSDAAVTYTYTVNSTPNGLCSDQATVDVSFETLPDPGTNGTITLCDSDAPVNLITVLGGTPDNGGSWSGPSALGGGDLGTFNPASNAAGLFTYEVIIGTCPAETAQVQVIILPEPDAGVPTFSTVCESFGNVDLFSIHSSSGTPNAGGTWTDNGGNVVPNSYDVSGQCGSSPIVLTYTVDNGTCSNSANLTLTIDCPTNAGPDDSFTYCGDGSTQDLNLLLPVGVDPGSWSAGPVITLNAASAGVYTYTTNANACGPDAANYTINIEDPISTSSVNALCEPNQTEYTVCFDIAGGDGNYTVTGGPGTIVGNQFCSDPIPAGTPYNFTISDGGPCADDNVSGPSPNCNCPATANITSGNLTICEGSNADIIVEFNGAGPFDFIYNDGVSDIPVNGVSSPYTLTVSPLTTTSYSLVSMSDANCNGSVVGSVTISVDPQLNAGPDNSFTYCGDGSTQDLNLLLPVGVDPGSWSAGPIITLNAASAGVYTYTTNGNACPADDADYTINIEEPLSTSGLTALCEANQTEYTVCFDIAGGDGNYTVTGGPGAIVGNQFCSDPIPVSDSYDFTISSTGICQDINVNNTPPDCNCTAQGSITGNAEICSGDCTDITFDLTGTPPFTVEYDGPDGGGTLSGISDGHILTVCPVSGAVYSLISVSDANCTGVVLGGSVTVNVDQPVFVSNIEETCDPTNQTYTLTFDITGGNGNYIVTPLNNSPYDGPPVSGTFTVEIPSGDGYSYEVTSSGNSCDPVIVETPFFDCGCATDAGSVSTTPLFVCDGECQQVVHFGNEFLDGNDILQFVLHDGTADDLGNVIATSNDGEFCFDYPQVNSGEVYYISAIAGNDQFGNVDLNDPCLSVSTGVEITQNPLPSATISGGSTVCPGEQVDLTISFTGTGPWDFVYNNGVVDSPTETSTSDTYILSVTQPGTYTITSMSDSNCTGSTFGQAAVQNFQPPSATISGDPNVCEGSGDGPLVEFSGTPPFSFTYAVDGEEQEQVFNVNSYSFTIPAEEEGAYSLVSLADNNCEGSVSGNINITIIEEPTATITGGGVVCDGDEATFNVILTGNAPWTLNYSIDGLPNTETITSPNYSFQSGIDGDYVITSVQDANCQASVASQATLVVNPLPTAELTASSSTFCLGQEVDLSMVLEGNPPFNVTYVINGDTLTATGIQSNIFETLTPDEPVLAEVLFIEDGSTPVCTNQPQESVFITPTELPNAPTLQDDTLCSANGRVQIGVTPVEGLTYSWSPENNLTDPDIANPEFVAPNIPGAQPVIYDYIITASNGDCESTDTMTLVLDPGPTARFSYSPNPVTTEDTKTFFNNNSINNHNTIFFWEFDTMETSFASDPSFTFPDGIEASYYVTLTATDPVTGCFDTYTERIDVRPDLLIFIPTAFTPDGDGLNDLWGPVLSNIDPDDYRLTVMDRWGEIVFETRDPNKKWNGGMNNGDYFAEPGVYIWIVETKEIGSLEEITQTGQVTLVR